MATTIVVGLDGTEQGEKVLAFAKEQARQLPDCTIAICFVIEWSPFAFQTNEENAERHKRREEELTLARERIIDPAVTATRGEGLSAEGYIRHGHAAEILEEVAVKLKATQIVVGRLSARNIREAFFGSVTGRLAAASSVPVTIIPQSLR